MEDLSPELTARIQALETSYEDNPGRYFVALAGAWREAGEVGRAEEILRENLKRFPGLSAHVLLGRCLADRGAFQEAANEFHYVLSIDAQNLIALRTLAEMAAAGGRRDEAERWYNELLSVDPMNAEARAALDGLSRTGADAATGDQPVQVGTDWGGAAEGEPAAGAAAAGDEFGMIDLDQPEASPADASGVAADEEAEGEPEPEWGDLALEPAEAEAAAPGEAAAGFDELGFGSVDLEAEAAPAGAEAGAGDWLDAEARQDLGESAAEDRGGLPPLDEAMLEAPLAGADLPFMPDDGAPDFPGFEPPAAADGALLPVPGGEDAGAGLPPFGADAEEQVETAEHVDAEVVTETMAELYAAQGLPERAAEVYRELIRQRGEEPGLVRRLAEIEARMQPAAAEPAPAGEEAPDWLASVDAIASGAAPSADAEAAAPAEPVEAPYAKAAEEAAEPVHAGASADPFADSFAAGFDGAEAEPAPAAAAADRAQWEAPAVAETEPVGFDLVVVREGDEEVPAPPEVVADVSADWAIAAAPLEEQEEAAEADRAAEAPAAAPAGARTMRAYFSSLLAWQPGGAAAPAEAPAYEEPAAEAPAAAEPPPEDEPWAAEAAEPAEAAAESAELPLLELEEEPWAEEPRAPEPPRIDAFELAEDFAAPASEAAPEEAAPAAEAEEALPWELPAEPVAAAPAEPPGAEGGFSFDDFFGGGAPAAPSAPAPEPQAEPQAEPEPELPPSFTPSAAFEPEAAAAPPPESAPAPPSPAAAPAGQEEDEDLESFQAWLQSLKR